ncbi:cysteine desulfurase family protein [Apilactobacillus xinyiensis]|uniref:Cysteine desulfurase n=1 Tax=Apilactobacillus xinyiensis TaxID=2841032 RepID=A0ABT0I208_9LACO|nr:cysteine desulfurase family protein [Apilactobacillus xinyiensis]MCK8624739.1 cysteine desulfurase [Apilactobacillus xinyiensis]MCL0318854.1 cysteine desulfurase [Apilactobacillus xinyiensis]
MNKVYLDNAATTPIADNVLQDMYDKFKNNFGNASTLYSFGRDAHTILENSRQVIANSINANADEIVFTSGGTESDNTAIIQVAKARKNLGNHIITTAIEHEAVLKPLEYLKNNGFEVTYLPVDKNGNISLEDLKNSLNDKTILVSVMYGNNEVGSLMPIHEIGELLKDHQAVFHTDAVQAYGLRDIDVKRDHIDLLSTSAHKINGPKMLGFLYRKNGIDFPSFIKGGDQEEKRRAGTENIPAISGFATAVSNLTNEHKLVLNKKFYEFKKRIEQAFIDNKIDFEINGQISHDNLQHVLNLWIKGISTYLMQTNLDLDGIAVSGGSACTAGSIEPSHVLKAMYGSDSDRINESIRISFGQYTTVEDVDVFIGSAVKIIKRLKK